MVKSKNNSTADIIKGEILVLAEKCGTQDWVQDLFNKLDEIKNQTLSQIIKEYLSKNKGAIKDIYNSSIYEYVFLTLISIYWYKKSNAKLKIIILTTQLPSSFDNNLPRRYSPYFNHEILKIYFDLFNKYTKDNKVNVSRYYICDDFPLNRDNHRIRLFYSEDELRTSRCPQGNIDSCQCYTCKRRIAGCYKTRDSFFDDVNPRANYYYLPLSLCSDEPFRNYEVRELIGFKTADKYDMVITSNLLDEMSSMFLKIYGKEEITKGPERLNPSPFQFLGVSDKSCEDYLSNIEGKGCMNLRELWGCPNKKDVKL